MPANPIAGHGAGIHVTMDPVAAPTTFTLIGNLNGDISEPTPMRSATETTPHDSLIDTYVLSVMRRDVLSFSINYIPTETTHNESTGILFFIKSNTFLGIKITPPPGGGSAAIVCSGYMLSMKRTAPVQEGAWTADVEFRPSGPMYVGSVLYGV